MTYPVLAPEAPYKVDVPNSTIFGLLETII